MNYLKTITCCAITFAALMFLGIVSNAQTGSFVWLEGEAPSSISPSTITPNIAGWGHPEYLSGGKWLQISIASADIDKQVPDSGIVLTYNFHSDSAGSRKLWDRIGYEYVRSAFDWRIDSGPWSTVQPTTNTIDLMELQDWNEVAWLNLGTVTITTGDHTLQIRLPKSQDSKGIANRILYASDAICLADSTFRPNSKYKPGDKSFLTPRDTSAAAKIYQANVTSGAQTSTSLKGDWEIARWDEDKVVNRDQPVDQLPDLDALAWTAIAVPADRNVARPDLSFAHRVLYRTQFSVSDDAASHAWILHFPSINLLGSVFVNGHLAGTTNTPLAVWDCDITRWVLPGKTNDLVVAIKDPYYAYVPDSGKDAHTNFNFPYSFLGNQSVSFRLDFPVWNHAQAGILGEPTLICAGRVYTADVFAMPSVKKKSLGLEITLNNTSDSAQTVTLSNAIVPTGGTNAEKTFADSKIAVSAESAKVIDLSEAWTNPKLWWPQSPSQYDVVTQIKLSGKIIDTRRTKFGFREWSWNGPNFALNGVPWHGRADLFTTGDLNQDVAAFHAHGQNMVRVWSEDQWEGVPVPTALDFYDRTGIIVRRTGIFDGEGFNYNLIENAVVDGKQVTRPRRALFDNWDRQLVAWAKGQRNHPSIMIWSMENEITFINSHNAGNDPITDPEMTKAAGLLAALDPTRPQMTDGGNALLDQSLPVYGAHYLEAPLDSLPNGAYDLAGLAHRELWPITEQKPIFFGETYFANGIEPADLATVGGEAAVIGKAEAHPAIGLIAKMMSEGYRWNGLSAFQFWMGGESNIYYNAWQPIAVLCRQWNWTFGSGQAVTRDLGIFNDTQTTQQVRLTWMLKIGERTVSTGSKTAVVPAGENVKFPVLLVMPLVKSRQEGNWLLTLSVHGSEIFHDAKAISVLPRFPKLNVPISSTKLTASHIPAGPKLLIVNPDSVLLKFATQLRVPFTTRTRLGNVPASAKVVLIGQNSLDAATSSSTALAALAAAGHVVIVLEQTHPLKFQALPIPTEVTQDSGEIAFIEDTSHPVMNGLLQKDFRTWSGDGNVYADAYAKPNTGAKSLIECGPQLRDSALLEIPTDRGLMLLTQMRIGHKLASDTVAQLLLRNMVQYGLDYHPSNLPVIAYGDNPLLVTALKTTGVNYRTSASFTDVLAGRKPAIIVMDATPQTLTALADAKAKVSQFMNLGGWVVLNNVTPDGLASFNTLVGVQHIMRPFRREKVTFAAVRNPLLAGLPAQDIVMGSGQQIFPWAAGQYPATDAFSYVVDYDDVAPFAKSTFFAYDNIVNNFTNADGWPLIINFPPPADGSPAKIQMQLPRPETITQFTWIGNTNYWPTTQVALDFGAAGSVPFDTLPNGEPQTFEVSPARTSANITLEVRKWQTKPGTGGNIGIDNIYLKAKRSPAFYAAVKPMLNIGALVSYPKGKGGIVLCNVLFKSSEAVPENADKKVAILATILRNLKAPFAGGKTIIAGSRLSYAPIDISSKANQYRNDQGWFGDNQFTFADLPNGKHVFAGVDYDVYNSATSPVPTVVMLGGSGISRNLPDAVTGIPVHRKADALFFLQAARLDTRRSADDIKNDRHYEMSDYVVHYADGQTFKVPVYAEIDVDDYHQISPAALPGAQLAWSEPYAGTPYASAAYSMQWNNPRPNVQIDSIDLTYGPDRRGVPALLAITAATAQ